MGAAVQGTVRLHTVADEPDATVLAGRGERMDRALEAIKRARLVSGYLYLKRLVCVDRLWLPLASFNPITTTSYLATICSVLDH